MSKSPISVARCLLSRLEAQNGEESHALPHGRLKEMQFSDFSSLFIACRNAQAILLAAISSSVVLLLHIAPPTPVANWSFANLIPGKASLPTVAVYPFFIMSLLRPGLKYRSVWYVAYRIAQLWKRGVGLFKRS
ncbi:hypothetical protein B0J14DRAFT_220131 [Halenospora varia]|nr:hypothetical protein B0J14DRAFT_220131 [Halenospora varia]